MINKMVLRKLYILTSFLVSLMMLFTLFSCGSSYEEAINDFNKKYFEEKYLSPEKYSTESKNFKESEMLDDVLNLPSDYLIILEAPEGKTQCVYEWKALIPQVDNEGKEVLRENVIGTSRTLKFTTPGVFSTDKENKLVLTVTEQSGKIYKDTAKVFITTN